MALRNATLAAVIEELSKGLDEGTINLSTVHPNIAVDYIVISEDKLRLRAIEFAKTIQNSSDWKTPAGIVLSFIGTLLTAEFKPSFGQPAEFWRALFVFATAAASLWLVRTGWSALTHRGASHIDQFLRDIKQVKPPTQEKVLPASADNPERHAPNVPPQQGADA